ncbi:MAG: helix-turn-helix domain-containing protein [Streptomyces sp.]|nr:helix-turn-helix domain-containing protein [Streptomyces sp.]
MRAGPVRRWDAERGTDLLATLHHFVDCNASPARTARLMGVHNNTVLQRLAPGQEWSGVRSRSARSRSVRSRPCRPGRRGRCAGRSRRADARPHPRCSASRPDSWPAGRCVRRSSGRRCGAAAATWCRPTGPAASPASCHGLGRSTGKPAGTGRSVSGPDGSSPPGSGRRSSRPGCARRGRR